MALRVFDETSFGKSRVEAFAPQCMVLAYGVICGGAYWPDNLMKRHIQPVAKAIGIHKKIG